MLVQYNHFSPATYTDNSSWESTGHQYIASAMVPLMSKKNVFLVGVEYSKLGFDYRGTENYKASISSISVPFGIITPVTSSTKMMCLLIPKIASDMQDVDVDDFQPGGVVIFTFTKKPALKFKYGLYYNREFFGNYFMPLAGIDWKMDERSYLYGVLPGSMNFEYSLSPKRMYFWIAYRSNTASYRLQTGDYIREGHTFWADNQLSAFLTFKTLSNIVIFAGGGYAGFRYFQAYSNNHKKLPIYPVYQQTKDQFYLSAGITYRIRLDDDYVESKH